MTETQNIPPPPLAPPTVQGPISMPGRRTVWPDWIAGLCLVYGLVATVGAVIILINRNALKSWVGEMRGGSELLKTTEAFSWVWPTDSITTILMSIFLFWVGIIILQRRPSCAKHAIRWSIVKLALGIPFVILTAYLQYVTTKTMIERGLIQANPPGAAYISLAFQVLMYIAWYLGFPVFLIIWFRRSSVKKRIAMWHRPLGDAYRPATSARSERA